MGNKTCIPFVQICFKHRFRFLFVSILVVIVMNPIIESIAPLRILFSIFITAVIMSATYALSQKMRHLIIGSILAVPALGFLWASDYSDSTALFLESHIAGVLFFVFVVVHILIFIFGQERVSSDLIVGAAVAYLLMAVIWSYVYLIIETLQPGSFHIPDGQSLGSRYVFVYYSLVTISTLGYGDVTPLTSIAGSFSVLEAVIGQLYLVTMIAWLVGVHVSQSGRMGPCRDNWMDKSR
ncbi:MAG: two pore domain potassium channel family protein [Deltaproteobacteria bacterium]|nr:two pore domain potassium channel family protein [Deltaproteobacteria bacterium]